MELCSGLSEKPCRYRIQNFEQTARYTRDGDHARSRQHILWRASKYAIHIARSAIQQEPKKIVCLLDGNEVLTNFITFSDNPIEVDFANASTAT